MSSTADSPTTSRPERLRASPPLARLSLVDRALRVSPRAPLLVFGPAVVVLVALGIARMPLLLALAWLAAGALFWTLTEYVLHRFVLHLEPDRGPGAKLHWMFHGAHHEHPNNPDFVVAPPLVSVPLAALFCLAFVLVLGAPAWLPFAAGFMAGYVAYDVTHYVLHQGRPRSRLARRLREQHMRHHFQDGTRSFGVTTPLWDHVFRTAGARRRGLLRRSGARRGV
jgi:dihydroceramide fatty acyl 2-hydroxylase